MIAGSVGDGINSSADGAVTNGGLVGVTSTVRSYGGYDMVTNAGTLRDGILLAASSVRNTGFIEGYRNGVDVRGKTALTNSGTIIATGTHAGEFGVYFAIGSSIENSRLIQGGLYIDTELGLLVNPGTIAGTSCGGSEVTLWRGQQHRRSDRRLL